MSPLYKYTLTPPCCHSTEQCSSAECEQKTCTNIQTLKRSGVIGGTGKQEQDRKESKAIVEWPYRLSLWQGHWWILGTHTCAHICTHNHPRHTEKSSTLTRRACRWRQCSFLRLSFRWKSHMFVSPSDAWPVWTWPSDYLKHTHIFHTFTQSYLAYIGLQNGEGKLSRGAAYQWSFLRWRREWLPRARFAQSGM